MSVEPSEFEDVTAGHVRVVLECHRVVIRLVGEHDLNTVGLVRAAFVEVVALEAVDVVVDLSATEFMDASTVGVLIYGRSLLEARTGRLTVRFPQQLARKVLDICELSHLIEPTVEPVDSHRLALGTWVAVPVAHRPEKGDRSGGGPELAAKEPEALSARRC